MSLFDFFFGNTAWQESDWVDYTYKTQAEADADIKRTEAESKAYEDKNASDFLWKGIGFGTQAGFKWDDEDHTR